MKKKKNKNFKKQLQVYTHNYFILNLKKIKSRTNLDNVFRHE